MQAIKIGTLAPTNGEPSAFESPSVESTITPEIKNQNAIEPTKKPEKKSVDGISQQNIIIAVLIMVFLGSTLGMVLFRKQLPKNQVVKPEVKINSDKK